MHDEVKAEVDGGVAEGWRRGGGGEGSEVCDKRVGWDGGGERVKEGRFVLYRRAGDADTNTNERRRWGESGGD